MINLVNANATGLGLHMNATTYRSMPLEDLADNLGEASAREKAAKATTDSIKEELNRRGVNAARGAKFIVSISTSDTTRLDTKAMGVDAETDKKLAKLLLKYSNTSTSKRVLVRPAPPIEVVD
jgi:hypothetical protein